MEKWLLLSGLSSVKSSLERGSLRLLLVGLALASKPELKPSFKSPHPLKLGIPNTEGSSHQESLWSAKAFLNHLSFGHGAERC